ANIAELERKWGYNWAYSGVATFGHLPHVRCLTNPKTPYDIGILGVPFDTATSYRPGARMGPRAIRTASARHLMGRGFNTNAGFNPYMSWASVLDCGDIPVTPFDNEVALRMMGEAFLELGQRQLPAAADSDSDSDEEGADVPAASALKHPKIIALGGDHLIALPALRALRKIYGQPLTLLHFDAHLDTLHPSSYPSAWASEQSNYNHGSVFYQASAEGLLANGSSVHAGINTRISGTTWADYIDDDRQGFLRIPADAIDDIGVAGILELIHARIGREVPVYLSIDIDVLDPAFAPGTGAPEPGGWSTREMMRIMRGLAGLNIVGADVVEVAPAYDSPGQDTAFVAANLVYEIITNMVRQGREGSADVPLYQRPGPSLY
ncbi:Ureohydrolase, partial [Geopyxis carbonaria]